MSDPNRKAEKAEKLRVKQEQYEQEIAGLTFVEWPKIARLNRDVVVTEKIDGTNAAVGVTADGRVYAQSRNRILTVGNDNFGFAAWVKRHEQTLAKLLGIGLHFGEWWGVGIGRGYDLSERRFSLFNVAKWAADSTTLLAFANARLNGCAIDTVPVLYSGPWTAVLGYHDATADVAPGERAWLTPEQMGGWEGVQDQPNPRPRFAPNFELEWLKRVGSQAAPGYMNPEGIVVFHRASGTLLKATIENDAEWKGKRSGEPDAGTT